MEKIKGFSYTAKKVVKQCSFLLAVENGEIFSTFSTVAF